MVQLFNLEVSFEEGSFKFVPELNFVEFDQGPIVLRGDKVLEPIDSAVMFATMGLIPNESHPELVLTALRFALVLERSHILDCA